jgi:glutamine synthetase
VLLPPTQPEALDALDQSSLLRAILGDEPIDAVLAVRRYEHENYGDLPPDQLAEKFRLAWSV